MNKNPLNKGHLTDNFSGTGSVTPEDVRARARELALLAGHPLGHVTPADYEQAKRELTGGSEQDAKEAILESAPESDRWNPVPGSPGHQAPESAPEDEDEEGRSETEQLVQEGVDEAERDQMLEAARAEEKKSRPAP
ncbi:MAG: hypothetical protein ABI222_03435 [Opitutaceae bacterium]